MPGDNSHKLQSSENLSDNFALYDLVELIIQELIQAGEAEWAERLSDAMAISCQPSEILGAIRHELRLCEKTRIPKKLGLSAAVKRAIKYINSVW